MGRPKFDNISWYTGTMQYYHGKLRLDLGDYLSKIS